jgi:hypothetical protein
MRVPDVEDKVVASIVGVAGVRKAEVFAATKELCDQDP